MGAGGRFEGSLTTPVPPLWLPLNAPCSVCISFAFVPRGLRFANVLRRPVALGMVVLRSTKVHVFVYDYDYVYVDTAL